MCECYERYLYDYFNYQLIVYFENLHNVSLSLFLLQRKIMLIIILIVLVLVLVLVGIYL